MRALVIGADGFVGRHLVEHLEESGDDVAAVSGPQSARSGGALDVRDTARVRDVVRSAAPKAIYNLAGIAFGPDASTDFTRALDVAVCGTAAVIEAAAIGRPTVLVTGSSEVYGGPPAGATITEEFPIRPANPYGLTKALQEQVALEYARLLNVPVVVTRSFNHIGPGQREEFVVSAFALQLARISTGQAAPVVRVGNLDAVRDFTDVRDVVRAYRLLVTTRIRGVAINVASGHGVRIGEILERLIAVSGLQVRVELDPARVRSDDPPRIVGDASKLRRFTGWKPAIEFSETLTDVWLEMRERVLTGSA
ncbi:MAG: GDP-mannose 4,6-dehydratase [Chloroflexota bacterium]